MSDKDKFIELYKDGFPEDGQAYIDYFFDNLFRAENAMINESETSALHIRYKTVFYHNKSVIFPFFVAVSTHSSRRGTGEIKNLIKQALQRLNDEGVPFAGLYPFRHDYYTKYGFVTADKCIEIQNTPDFHKLEMPLSKELIDKNIKIYHSLYTDFCKVFDIHLTRDIADMSLKFKGLLSDGAIMEHYVLNDKLVAYKLLSHGEVEDIGGLNSLLKLKFCADNAQCRVINVKNALELQNYNCEKGTINLEIIDELLGNSYWQLSFNNGKAIAEKLAHRTVNSSAVTVEKLTKILFGQSNNASCELANYIKPSKVFIVDKY